MDFTEAYSDRCSTAGHAARSDNIKCMRRLIKRGNSIDIRDNRGFMPIHEAAFCDSSKCLRLLLQAAPSNTYIKTKTFEGETPLHLSAKRGGFESTKLLLQAGADPNELTSDETTALFLAVKKQHADIVRLLLEHGANVNGSHSRSGWNALHQAAFQASIRIMKCLLEHGVDKEWQDDFGITPLFVAAQYGKLESLKVLLSHGASVNCQAKDKATPLFITAQEGHWSCAELLLAHGANPNLYCNEDNWQLPIHSAAQMGHPKTLALLIPITDKSCDTGEGKVSPVYSALYGGKGECLELLLKEGFSPDAQPWRTSGCNSPMSMVFKSKNFGAVDILLKYGAHLTGIHLRLCLNYGNFPLFRYFLARGCLLPCGKNLQRFRQSAAKVHVDYKEWLPYLLLAGFNPRNLLRRSWICSVKYEILNFVLEFTNSARLPPAMDRLMFAYAESSSWIPKEHFGLPALSHLCRLEIRSLLRSENLRSDKYIKMLPLPTCLQDFLLYKDILRTYNIL